MRFLRIHQSASPRALECHRKSESDIQCSAAMNHHSSVHSSNREWRNFHRTSVGFPSGSNRSICAESSCSRVDSKRHRCWSVLTCVPRRKGCDWSGATCNEKAKITGQTLRLSPGSRSRNSCTRPRFLEIHLASLRTKWAQV